MKPDTPHRFVQRSIDLFEVGAEITDTAVDDFAIAAVQSNDALKKFLGDRLARLIDAPSKIMAIDAELQHTSQAAAIDPVKLFSLLQMIWQLWNQFRKPNE